MKKNILRYIVTGLIMVGFYFYLQVDKKAAVIIEDNEYPFIKKNSFDYQGVITSKTMSGVYRGTKLFGLSNGQKFSVSGLDYLQIGDSIHRPANMDSIFIYKNGKESRIFFYRKK